MFRKKQKALSFLLETLTPLYSIEFQEKKHTLFMPKESNSSLLPIVFFKKLHKKQVLQKRESVIWIVIDSFLHKRRFTNVPLLYFLVKEKPKNSFALYDRKYLLTQNGRYPLPPLKVALPLFAEDLSYIKNPKHRRSLLQRQNSPKKPLQLTKNLYSFLKEKLDK